MKPTIARWVSAASLCVALAGCGSDGETVDSTGVDTSSGGSSSLAFAAPSTSVNEAAGTVTVTVVRTGGSGAVSVQITSLDGTANAPEDYTAVSSTLAFAAGETGPKGATIVIVDDEIDEPDETLRLMLSVPSGGATLGSTSEVLVTIDDDDVARPAAPTAAMSAAYKQLHVDWTGVPDANRYRLMKDPTGHDGFSQVGAELSATARSVDFDVVLLQEDWLNARYVIEACNGAGCTPSNSMSVTAWSVPLIGYLKAANTGADDRFGYSVAMSSDGTVLAVGAPAEDGAGTEGNSGAVYVYTRTGSEWSEPVYIKASNAHAGQEFGYSIALSRDGNTLVVGAPGASFVAGTVYVYTRSGSQWSDPVLLAPQDVMQFGLSVALSRDGSTLAASAVDPARGTGVVYVYTRSDSTWSQPDSLAVLVESFGTSMAFDDDGNTLAVGAPGESNGAGSVYVYTRSDSTWSQPAQVTGSKEFQRFGSSVALSQNGNRLAAGAPYESDAAGAVYIYTRSPDSTWSPPVHVRASNTGPGDRFGSAVAFDLDGSVLAVGAPGEFGGTAGLASAADDAASNEELPEAGAVYVYTRTGSAWTPSQYTKASNPDVEDAFGSSLALNADGSILAVGAIGEDSASTGFNRNQFDDDCGVFPEANCASDSGAVYVY